MENYDLQPIHDFDDLGIKSDLLRGIYAYGYERPSEIQQKAILPILQGFDVVAQAQSGSGKTASFIIPVLQLIDEDLQECQAIILVPTLDLAQQISHLTLFHVKKGLMKRLAEFLKISILFCDKSTSLCDIEGIQILIGTPERMLNMLKLGEIKPSALKILVVDEADRLIIQEETREILESLTENVQVVMISITMPDDLLMIAKKYTRNPMRISIKQEEVVLERFRHLYILVDEKEQKIFGTTQTIIYCRQKETVDEVTEILSKKSLECSKIVKDDTMEFPDREAVMMEFRVGKGRILVMKDILSSGIEIRQPSIVLNYDLPLTKEEYIHKLGLCSRLRSGIVINFVTPNEVQSLKELEKCSGVIFDHYTDYFF